MSQRNHSRDSQRSKGQKSVFPKAEKDDKKRRLDSFDSGACSPSDDLGSSPTTNNTSEELTMDDLAYQQAHQSASKTQQEIAWSQNVIISPYHTLTSTLVDDGETTKPRSTRVDGVSSQKIYAQLSERVISLVEENSTNMETLRQTEDKLEFSQSRLADSESQVIHYKTELDEQIARNKELETSLLKSDTDREMMSQQVDECNRKVKKAELALFEHANQVSSLVEGYHQKATEDQQILVQKNGKLKKQVEELAVKLNKANKLIEQMGAERQEKEGDTVKALMTAQERIAELLHQHDQNRTVIKNLEEEKAKVELAKKQLQASFDEQRQRHDDLQQQLAQSQQDHHVRVEQLTKELKNGEKKLRDYGGNLIKLAHLHGSNTDYYKCSSNDNETVLNDIKLCLSKKEAYIQRLEAEQNSLNVTENHNEHLKTEISTLIRRVKAENLRVIELETLCDSLQNANKQLNEKTSEFTTRVIELQTESESLENRLQTRTAELLERKEKMAKLEEIKVQVQVKDQKIAELQQDLSYKNETAEEMRLEISMLENELQQARHDVEHEKKLAIETTAQHRNLTGDMTAKFNTHTSELSDKLEQSQAECSRLRSETGELRNQQHILAGDKQRCLNEMELLKQEMHECKIAEENKTKCHQLALKNLQEMAANDSKRVKQLEMELVSSRNELETHMTSIDLIQDQYKETISQKNDRICELESKVRLHTGSLQEEQEMKKALEVTVQERTELVKQLNNQLHELEEEKAQLNMQMAMSAEEWHASRERLGEEAEALRRDVEEARKEVEEKKVKIEELNGKLSVRESELEEARDESQQRHQLVSKIRAEKDERCFTYEMKERELAEIKRQMYSKTDEIASLNTKLSKTEKEKERSEKQANQLEFKITTLDSNRQELESSHERLQEKLCETKEEARDARQQIVQLEESSRKLQHELAGKEKQLYELQLQNEDCKYKLHTTQEQLVQLSTLGGSLKSQVDQLKQELDSKAHITAKLASALKMKKQQLQATVLKVNTLTKSLAEAKEEVASLKQVSKFHLTNEELAEGRVLYARGELQRLYSEMGDLHSEASDMSDAIMIKEQETKELKSEIAKLKQSKESFEKQCKKELSKTQADSESLSRFYQKEIDHLRKHNKQLLRKQPAIFAAQDQRKSSSSRGSVQQHWRNQLLTSARSTSSCDESSYQHDTDTTTAATKTTTTHHHHHHRHHHPRQSKKSSGLESLKQLQQQLSNAGKDMEAPAAKNQEETRAQCKTASRVEEKSENYLNMSCGAAAVASVSSVSSSDVTDLNDVTADTGLAHLDVSWTDVSTSTKLDEKQTVPPPSTGTGNSHLLASGCHSEMDTSLYSRLFAPIRDSEADFAVADKSFSAENISHMGSIPSLQQMQKEFFEANLHR